MAGEPCISNLQFMTSRELVDHLTKEKNKTIPVREEIIPMTIAYFQATRCISLASGEQITTLASGDADFKRLSEHARELGWPIFAIRKWVSNSSGDERCPDGKDVYRLHQGRLMAAPLYMTD